MFVCVCLHVCLWVCLHVCVCVCVLACVCVCGGGGGAFLVLGGEEGQNFRLAGGGGC